MQRQIGLPAAVIFDMDGVLVNSNPYHLAKWIEFLDHHKISYKEEELPELILGKRNDTAFKHFLGPDLPPEERARDRATDWRKVSIPIHHLESLCAFGQVTVTPPALDLCWEHGVAVHFLSESGYLQARLTGVADTSVLLRRAQFRAADDRGRCAGIARSIIAGKLQNSRTSLLRGARESEGPDQASRIEQAAEALARQIRELAKFPTPTGERQLDALRGAEGMGAQTYFGVFTLLLKQQREEFAFVTRTRRPPRDREGRRWRAEVLPASSRSGGSLVSGCPGRSAGTRS